MAIKKIVEDVYLNISDDEVVNICYEIMDVWYSYLQDVGVKPLWKPSTYNYLMEHRGELTNEEVLSQLNIKMFWLIILTKYRKMFVSKELITKFVKKYRPTVASDQQVRHLYKQEGWYVLIKGMDVPDTNEKVPSGFYCLFSLEQINPLVVRQQKQKRRDVLITNDDFEEIKKSQDYYCATCHLREDSIDPRTGKQVKLQMGHRDPNKPLTYANTMAQCEYCNRTLKDDWVFDEDNMVHHVNNPRVIDRSPAYVQGQIFEHLKKNRGM